MTLPQDIELTRLDGSTTTTGDFAGKVLLIVNTASRCGFTPQYEGLEKLHETYAARGLVVMGFPCNQFGQQEPGDAAEIGAFCSTKFGVGFPMFAKVEVNGERAHPLYRHLKSAAPGLLGIEAIKWNFTKFLVARDGRVVSRHAPTTSPESLVAEIEALL
ncbi:glutathione peroxidase [Derxia gummosa]|uniref:Glutathione peroxidase n=1 Tax=Derxia gummosa DSM 723 TaxID=1121388 RepID=A0A8B6X276_9BURK|nr:glutathione peroxidase [Derxia gummosa]